MNREEFESRFIEILGQGGEPLDDPEMQSALAADPELAKNLDELRAVLSRFDETDRPELAGHRNIDLLSRAFEEGYRQGRRLAAERSPVRSWRVFWRFVPAAAMAVVAVVFSVAVWQRTSADTELDLLRSDVHSLQQLLAISLLEQESATQRLRGVQWTRKVDDPAGNLLTALAYALQRDRNPNVRLAAADAMGYFVDQPTAKASVFEAIESESNPIVQIELIDVLITIRDEQTTGVLEGLVDDPNLPGVVRDRANAALNELGGSR